MPKTIILDPSPELWRKVKRLKLETDPKYRNLNEVACMLIERGLQVTHLAIEPSSPRAPLPVSPPAPAARRAPAASRLGRPKGSKNSPPPNTPIWQRALPKNKEESQDVPATIKAIAEKVQKEKAEKEKPQEINTPPTIA